MKNENQNSYKKLFSNTIIFAIGSFSSKLLVFLLLPLYTRALSKGELGSVDLIVQLANLVLPLATLSIAESVIRFGLDRKYNNATVFSTGIVITLAGLAVFTAAVPLFSHTKYVKGFGLLFFGYVLCAGIKLVLSEFVRARGLVKLYAFNGILTTFLMLTLNIIFLLVMKTGIKGYLLAIVLSDLVSIIFLFFIAELYRFLKLRYFSKEIAKQMLAFSVPLIPAAVMWWVTNVSDRFLVQHFMGNDANGIYTIAYKIPTIITTIYAMFNQAWNMSAITESDSKGRARFYKNVFDSNQSVLYVLAAAVMVMLIPLTKILVESSFFISYKYAPILIVATVFTCFTSFLGSIYAAAKKTKHSFFTSLLGAVVNIILNLILIPKFGINGASFATLVSYALVFVIRMIDIKKFAPFKVIPGRILVNTLLLTIMAYCIVLMNRLVALPLIILFVIILAINYSHLEKAFKKVLPKRILRLIPFIK